jgi:hypothetical protein
MLSGFAGFTPTGQRRPGAQPGFEAASLESIRNLLRPLLAACGALIGCQTADAVHISVTPEPVLLLLLPTNAGPQIDQPTCCRQLTGRFQVMISGSDISAINEITTTATRVRDGAQARFTLGPAAIAAVATTRDSGANVEWTIPVEFLGTFDSPSDARQFTLHVDAQVVSGTSTSIVGKDVPATTQ